MKIVKSYLSKINFALGRSPGVIKKAPSRERFMPADYKSVLVVSCDLELAWAWRFAKEAGCDLKNAQAIAQRERGNVPFVLQLCEQFNIPVTWAVVGHLFLEECVKENGVVHPDVSRIKYFENKYWKFLQGEWFDGDPCCKWHDALGWYAPDVIKSIINSKVKHELACHTFSHINCSDNVCSDKVFSDEIKKCRDLAARYNITLDSFVFPANLPGHLDILKKEGFISYRVDDKVLGVPEKDIYGLWRIPTTATIGPSSYKWSPDYCVERYKVIIERAIKYGRVCHFWFHPSLPEKFLKETLSALFSFVDTKRKELCVATMRDYSRFLQSAEKI